MTADTVWQAMRRFTARRGFPQMLYSDNGSQLKAIRDRLLTFISQLRDSNPEYDLRLNWELQPAISPWRGGFYERLIRTVKDSLQAYIFKAEIGDSELTTVLMEVESRMNDRPLFYYEGEAISPSCFFAGKPLGRLPSIGNNSARNITRDGIINTFLKT